jgi:N-acylneuraminate cytidylyltransferase
MLDQDPQAIGVLSCSQPTFNPYWVGVVDRGGYIAPAFPEYARLTRRQDVPPFYRINGLLFAWRRDFAAAAPAGWSPEGHRMLEVPEIRAISIDDLFEFRLAEHLLATGAVELPWLCTHAGTTGRA